jgi:hypothetical protein
MDPSTREQVRQQQSTKTRRDAQCLVNCNQGYLDGNQGYLYVNGELDEGKVHSYPSYLLHSWILLHSRVIVNSAGPGLITPNIVPTG